MNIECKNFKYLSKLYRNWWIHNTVAHPLMQILKPFSTKLSTKVHDITLPVEGEVEK